MIAAKRVMLTMTCGLLMLSSANAQTTRPRELRDVIGVTHVAGRYNFSKHDYLNEGADALLGMGTRVIKVWFMAKVDRSYPFNSDWPKVHTLVDIAKTPYFRELFSKPFTTFILETYAPGRPDHYYLGGMNAEQIAREESDVHDLAEHLMREYRGSGKTFVIQNWEGDWSLRGGTEKNRPGPTPKNITGMIDWFNARQAGVERARRENPQSDVSVLHAAEVNHVAKAMEGKTTVTNDVLPQTKCDLYSYSCYDVPEYEPKKLRAALDYLASKAPGENNVYLGEYGAPENVVGGPDEQLKRTKVATETALDWGARYIVYWELYCNEAKRELTTRPKNDDMRGFWLIRPDGSRPPVTDYFIELWKR